MSNHRRGPFPELQGLSYVDVLTAPLDTVLERMALVNAALAAAGCNCNGHAQGQQRDEYFGADISELVSRATEHDVYRATKNGGTVTETVRVRLETLSVDVDSNAEVMAWIYEES